MPDSREALASTNDKYCLGDTNTVKYAESLVNILPITAQCSSLLPRKTHPLYLAGRADYDYGYWLDSISDTENSLKIMNKRGIFEFSKYKSLSSQNKKMKLISKCQNKLRGTVLS